MAEKRTQPEWFKPAGVSKGLKVNNSMKLGELTELVPQEGNLLRWYTCGPTVYDDSHLGHARNYLTFDIIRRIVEDYFHYDIFYCMNITDIDDKIIIKSRRNYFFAEYSKANSTITEDVKKRVAEAWNVELEDLNKKIAKNDVDAKGGKKNVQELAAARSLLDEKKKKAEAALAAAQGAAVGSPSTPILVAAQDPLSALIDKSEGTKLDAEFIKKICDDHSKKYEKEFFEDMKKLGVKVPDVVVRVSEYVPQVIAMVERIIKNGYAYASEGSVYFDSARFHTSPGHVYGKLAPWSIGNVELLAEGEGALTASGVRKSEKDFALWKASKAGEPSWDSPWGKGRPGWHIECSAMAGEILGSVLDVHCGGADLKFPHHDNELAQAEACFDCKQWVNYFLHSGHLDIDGLKMSKSLKNFITIKDTFGKFSAKQLRLLFLLQAWDSKMNYQVKDTMVEVDAKDKAFTEFLNKVKALSANREDNITANESWNARDLQLHEALLTTQKTVHAALSNNFNTSEAINALTEIVNKSNAYIAGNPNKKALVLSKVAAYVVRILNVFGLEYSLGGSSSSSSSASSSEVLQNVAGPIVNELANFRKAVRLGAKEKKEPSYFLDLCDKLRDEQMPQHGVKIVDDNDFNYFFVDKDELLAEIARKKAESAEGAKQKQIKSLQNKIAQLKKDLDKWEKNAQSPQEHIKQRFNVDIKDPKDLPAADLSGKELSNSAKKQIPKVWEQQQESYSKYQQEIAKDANFLENFKTQIADLEKQLQQVS